MPSNLILTIPLVAIALAAVVLALQARRHRLEGAHRLEQHAGPVRWLRHRHPADELFDGELALPVDASEAAQEERRIWRERQPDRAARLLESGWYG